MGRRAELFIRELSDGEAEHLLKLCRRSRDPVVQHRAMLLFASYQGQSVSEIARLHRASATHVAELIHAFDEEGFACLDPRWGGARPRRIVADQRAAIVKVALARPADLGEPFTSPSLSKLRAHLLRAKVVPTISRSGLWRILREHGIRFLHHKTRKSSPDPDFEAKKNRVLDLYAHPPKGSRVLCLDEFGPLNLQLRLGHGWQRSGHPDRFRATYTRTAGVRQLLAAGTRPVSGTQARQRPGPMDDRPVFSYWPSSWRTCLRSLSTWRVSLAISACCVSNCRASAARSARDGVGSVSVKTSTPPPSGPWRRR